MCPELPSFLLRRKLLFEARRLLLDGAPDAAFRHEAEGGLGRIAGHPDDELAATPGQRRQPATHQDGPGRRHRDVRVQHQSPGDQAEEEDNAV